MISTPLLTSFCTTKFCVCSQCAAQRRGIQIRQNTNVHVVFVMSPLFLDSCKLQRSEIAELHMFNHWPEKTNTYCWWVCLFQNPAQNGSIDTNMHSVHILYLYMYCTYIMKILTQMLEFKIQYIYIRITCIYIYIFIFLDIYIYVCVCVSYIHSLRQKCKIKWMCQLALYPTSEASARKSPCLASIHLAKGILPACVRRTQNGHAQHFAMRLLTSLGPQNHEEWRFYTPNIWVITPKNEGCGFPWFNVFARAREVSDAFCHPPIVTGCKHLPTSPLSYLKGADEPRMIWLVKLVIFSPFKQRLAVNMFCAQHAAYSIFS